MNNLNTTLAIELMIILLCVMVFIISVFNLPEYLIFVIWSLVIGVIHFYLANNTIKKMDIFIKENYK
jgi:hypothetical protein